MGVFGFSSLFQTDSANAQNTSSVTVRRVLLISIDGFHAMDLAVFVRSHPNSALALLSSSGITYTEASTSRPSNSFPGLLSLVTGGSPASTGVWYEGAYARTLSAPGSDCKTVGTKSFGIIPWIRTKKSWMREDRSSETPTRSQQGLFHGLPWTRSPGEHHIRGCPFRRDAHGMD